MDPLNWVWALLLIVLTIALHAAGIVLNAFALEAIRARLDTRYLTRQKSIIIVIFVVTWTALLLAILHGIEIGMWAAAYIWVGAIASPADAILYSVDSMSTRGASGLRLASHWRTMGALEAVDGMLLFGISTAYIFAVLHEAWQFLLRPR